MGWCEANGVDFLFGLAKNARLAARSPPSWPRRRQRSGGEPASRRGASRTSPGRRCESWSRPRRVVGKAEWTRGEANPRFVVTSLTPSEHEARHLYEKVYCARGDMENRIKECQLDLFADRTSTATMRANQLRLWFASMAYVLVCALRRIALRHTQFAEATCGTIRLKLFKIGALVRDQRPPHQARHGLGLPLPARVPSPTPASPPPRADEPDNAAHITPANRRTARDRSTAPATMPKGPRKPTAPSLPADQSLPTVPERPDQSIG